MNKQNRFFDLYRSNATLSVLILLLLLTLITISGCSTATSARTSMIGIKSAKKVAVMRFKGPENLREQITVQFTRALKSLNKFEIYNADQIQEFMESKQLDTDIVNSEETRRVLRETLEIDGVFTAEFITYKGNNPRRTADHIQITLRMVSTENGRVSYSSIAKSDMTGLLTGDQLEVIEAVVDMLIKDVQDKF